MAEGEGNSVENKKSDAPLITRVMQDIRQRIKDRHLVAGSRLPSIRAQAASIGVSKSTVVNAYERLVAEGVIEPRAGSGFYVNDRPIKRAMHEAADYIKPEMLSNTINTPNKSPALGKQDIDPVWIIRHSLDDSRVNYQPGCGWLPETWMPTDEIRRALRMLSRQPAAPLTGYGTPQGLPALRELLAHRINDRGIVATPKQLMMTESGTQAVDLICRVLLTPGDTVIVDDPCYFSFQALLKAHKAKVVRVPYTVNGPDLAVFEHVLKTASPRLYITNAALHNPTGASLSFDTAHRLLKLAEQFDLMIIEDDVFADFEWRPAPRLAALDGLNRVIHTGSFSKTLSASVRVGYIAASERWLEELIDLKLATAFESGHFSAKLLHLLLSSGAYRKHIEGMRKRLSSAMNMVIERLSSVGISPWIEPRGGMFLWTKLPEGISAKLLAQEAVKQQVLLAPGTVFSESHNADNFMRFNVAQCQSPYIYDVMRRLMVEMRTQ